MSDSLRLFDPDDDDAICAWLRALRERAWVPESHYRVAAIVALPATDGKMIGFGGVNVESRDHRLSVHAEESALALMVAALGKSAVAHRAWTMGDNFARPCGNCRQQLTNLATGPGMHITCLTPDGDKTTSTLGHLLPDPFTFQQIDPEIARFRPAPPPAIDSDPLSARVIRRATPEVMANLSGWLGGLESIDYASRIHHAVALELENGYIVAGTKVENAAFTGLNAMQSALGIVTSHFGHTGIAGAYAFSADPNRSPMPLSAAHALYDYAGAKPPVSVLSA